MRNSSCKSTIVKVERCGFAEPDDERGAIECGRMGLRIIVREPFFGRLMSIVRCHDHSDWIEAILPPASAGG